MGNTPLNKDMFDYVLDIHKTINSIDSRLSRLETRVTVISATIGASVALIVEIIINKLA